MRTRATTAEIARRVAINVRTVAALSTFCALGVVDAIALLSAVLKVLVTAEYAFSV